MSAILDAPVTRLAFCWRVERRDGVCLGFTSHDRDLHRDGMRYRAAPGMLPSAVALSDGFEADTLDVRGALTSEAITAADLAAGRWDRAAVSLFLVDWNAPEAEPVPLARGEIGDVTAGGGGFAAELRGPAALLDAAVVEQTSPECRASLGDKRCRVDMAARTRLARIAAVSGEVGIVVDAATGPDGAHAYGRVRWIGGPNSGLDSAVLGSTGTLLTLREPPLHAPVVGDRIVLEEGCDKSFATCAGRFANAANFRGEPHLPGIDLLTRYPGA